MALLHFGNLDYTHGEVNYFTHEKVKKVAMFPQRIHLSKTKNISFSDGTPTYAVSIGAMCFLKSLYGDDIILPELSAPTINGNVYSIKELLWFDTEYQKDAKQEETFFYDRSEWYIKKTPQYAFAAKGGHNNEPHNHNDIGSFMLVVGDEIQLADFGFGEYVKATFQAETRYTFLVNGSQGHSVPIVNGGY